MTDDEKRQKFLQRLANAGMTEEQWDFMMRRHLPDVSGLDAREAHLRARALQVAAEREVFEAIPRIKELLGDDAPVVDRGARFIVFEVRMHALKVLQDLYRRSRKEWDIGTVQVAKAAPAADLEQRAAAALADASNEQRADVLARVDHDLETRICPRPDDRALVRAYRVLQEMGAIRYETQTVDPTTYLTPLQEEVFASQVKTLPARPFLRIGTATPPRTLGWITWKEEGGGDMRISEHPLADVAWEKFRALTDGNEAGMPREPLAYLRNVGAFLEKFGFVAELME